MTPTPPGPLVAFISMPSGGEWLLGFLILLLLFGRRLPEVGRSLGQGIHEFKKGLLGSGGGAENASPPTKPGPGENAEPKPH